MQYAYQKHSKQCARDSSPLIKESTSFQSVEDNGKVSHFFTILKTVSNAPIPIFLNQIFFWISFKSCLTSPHCWRGGGASEAHPLRFFVCDCQTTRGRKLKRSDFQGTFIADILCNFWPMVRSGHQVRSAGPPLKIFATTSWIQFT